MGPYKKITGIACRRFFIDEFIPCFVSLTYCFDTKPLLAEVTGSIRRFSQQTIIP